MKPIIIALLTLFTITSQAQDKIPIRYNGHIYLTTRINQDKLASLVFDTGADFLYIDSLFFNDEGLSCENLAKAALPGVGDGFQKINICLDPYIFSIGEHNATSKLTSIIDLKNILGRQADGIFGTKFLTDKAILINYQKKFMRISNPENADMEGYTKVPISWKKNKMFVNAEVKLPSGKVMAGEYLLDLGSSSPIALSGKTTRDYNIQALDLPTMDYYTNRGGIGGKSSGFLIQAASASVDGFSLKQPVITCSLDEKGALGNTQYLGLLGNGFLEHFEIIIDIANSKLYLKPQTLAPKLNTFPTAGFKWIDRTDITDGWLVRLIYKDSPAEKAGLQLEDIITHINNMPVTSMNFEDGNALLEQKDAPILLRIRRGGEIKSISYKLLLLKVDK